MAEATIRDVARHAAVSVASVSRALNGYKYVRPDMRARVVAAAKVLGYVPHAGARSLSIARANALGVVLPDLHGEFFSELVRGMDREASGRGLQLLLSNMHADADQAAHALRAMRGRVDGLVIMAPQLTPRELREALPDTLPAVLINCQPTGDGRPAVSVDNRAGITALVRHLVDTGRRRIVHIAGPASNIDARERAAAFGEAIAVHAPRTTGRTLPGDFSEEAGQAAARALLAEGMPVDAVLAANDMMALGCLQALRAAGVEVPGQVAVAGFDDVPLARYLSLTTMRVRVAEIGARAVVRLSDLIEGGARGVAAEFHTPELVVRATTLP